MNGGRHANEFLPQVPGWVIDERSYFSTYFLLFDRQTSYSKKQKRKGSDNVL